MFKKQGTDQYVNDLIARCQETEREFEQLLPQLDYKQKLELALDMQKNTICCSVPSQWCHDFVCVLLEEKLKSFDLEGDNQND